MTLHNANRKECTPLPDKPQQQTLSVRISEALRQRLERAKQLVAAMTGEYVSTSEIAKQLLESAREDRLEVVDLLAEPTKTLLGIRKKGQAGQSLSKAEWTVLAFFIQQGLEGYLSDAVSRVSRESLSGMLEAFLAVYELRQGASHKDAYYAGNLADHFLLANGKTTDDREKVTPDVVRRTIGEIRRQMDDPRYTYKPLFIGRNLYVLLEEPTLAPGAEALNRALRPYWMILWKLAARGHYYLYKQPIREEPKLTGDALRPLIPSLQEEGFMLSFARGEGNDFSVLLAFPGTKGPLYPLDGYPKMAEFLAMLAALGPQTSSKLWKGDYFFGYLVESGEAKDFAFRANDNGITLTLSRAEWKAVQELFRRAWQLPDVRLAWEGLMLEYGEL